MPHTVSPFGGLDVAVLIVARQAVDAGRPVVVRAHVELDYQRILSRTSIVLLAGPKHARSMEVLCSDLEVVTCSQANSERICLASPDGVNFI